MKYLEKLPINHEKNKKGEYCYNGVKMSLTHDEFVIMKRGIESFESDESLVEWLKKVTSGFQKFVDAYISDYTCGDYYDNLTDAEFKRVKEYQKELIQIEKDADNKREWKLKESSFYADNSVEETYVDKNGIEKTIMTVQPHGDICF